MAATAANSKQQAHELIDRLSPGQASAVVGLLEAMLDPVAAALAQAPLDEQVASGTELREIAEARAALARGEGISNEDVLADFGLTLEDFERMSRSRGVPQSRTRTNERG